MRRALFALADLLRSAAAWALGASLASSLVSGVGRALCLQPYWPAGYAFRCRPNGVLEALVRLPLDVVWTALFIALAAFLPGAGIHLLVRSLKYVATVAEVRVVGALVGGLAWVLLMRRLEPSYLDFILGGYGIAAGAAVAAWVAGWYVPRGGEA